MLNFCDRSKIKLFGECIGPLEAQYEKLQVNGAASAELSKFCISKIVILSSLNADLVKEARRTIPFPKIPRNEDMAL